MSIATQERSSGTVSTRARDIATGILLAGKMLKKREDLMIDPLIGILQGKEPITDLALSGDTFEVTYLDGTTSSISKDGTVQTV